PEHQRLVGYFASPVLLKLDLSGDPPFQELLRRVQDTVWGALEHQGYPFPLLVERLHPDRDGRSRGLQVMFVHQQAAALRSFGGWRREVDRDGPVAIPDHIAALLVATMHRGGEAALSLELFSGDRVVLGGFAYDTRIFAAATAGQFANSLRV